MTIKLFENNSLLKQCVAKVTACTPKDGKYLVELGVIEGSEGLLSLLEYLVGFDA